MGIVGRAIPVTLVRKAFSSTLSTIAYNNLGFCRKLAVKAAARAFGDPEIRERAINLIVKPAWPLRLAKLANYVCQALRYWRYLWKPMVAAACCWALGVYLWNRSIPPPYDAPPGVYTNGGPYIEVTQEEAEEHGNAAIVPAPLARLVQERVMLNERDPVMMGKVKAIATRWCDAQGLTGNERFNAVTGAMAAALTVTKNEMNLLGILDDCTVRKQHTRIKEYVAGTARSKPPWYSRLLAYRR